MICEIKKYISRLFLDRNFENSDFFVIWQISIQRLDRLLEKIKNDSFMFLCVLLCFVHDMDTIWIDLIKYRSLNSVDLSLPFKELGNSRKFQ